jgi:hypothetical protein
MVVPDVGERASQSPRRATARGAGHPVVRATDRANGGADVRPGGNPAGGFGPTAAGPVEGAAKVSPCLQRPLTA